MKKIFFALSICVLAFNLFGEVVISAKTDRTDALYKVGEPVKFMFETNEPGKLSWKVTFDGNDLIDKGQIVLASNTFELVSTLNNPGFLRCDFTFQADSAEDKSIVAAGAAFEPTQIKPAAVMPTDFDFFWEQRKRQLACIPINPEMVEIESESDDVVTYDLTTDCLGKQVYGYYCRPKDAEKKGCPAVISLHGAGVASARKDIITYFADRGFIALEINANGVVNGREPEYYAELYQTVLKNYRHWGKENQYTSYFTGMFTRVLRGLEFLKSQPEWNGEVLAAYGASQGGAQSLAAAGLDSDVNIIFSGVTAMCDHGGHINGWPKFVPKESDGSYNKQILDASMYNDGVNFARRANAKAIFSCGFIDNVCRPTSVYAAYNSYLGDKEMLHAPLNAHPVPPEYYEYAKEQIVRFANEQ
ncbi:MAG: acetylxylan esterase [Sedimentisphaeraceae bacterium JB056]